jgi:CheY-like chemotaxis protein
MPARYRVALHGFSEFERRTLSYCFGLAATREPGYVQVEPIAEAEFIVAEGDTQGIAGGAIGDERLGDTLFIGDGPPPGVGMHLQRPIDPERILRALDRMAAKRDRRIRRTRPGIVLPLDAADSRFPLLHAGNGTDTTPGALAPDPVPITFTELKPLGAAQAATPPRRERFEHQGALPAMAPGPSVVERRNAKAAAKSASRRIRMAQVAADAANAPRDVLLLDPSSEPLPLGALLEMFGFQVHRIGSIAAAMSVLERTPLAAVFLDVDVQDATGFDGMHLCHRIKHRLLPLAGAVPAVMLMSAHDSAAERVRATLAGCDALLALPVTRGDAARALESCKVALPADPRRS